MNPLDPSSGRAGARAPRADQRAVRAARLHRRGEGRDQGPAHELGLAKRTTGGSSRGCARTAGGSSAQGPLEVVAGGRDDWVGWVELRPTGRRAGDAPHGRGDPRRGRRRARRDRGREPPRAAGFSSTCQPGAAPAYPHVMLIDGNDDRGIDVGILTQGYPLERDPLARRRHRRRGRDVQPRLPRVHLRTPAGSASSCWSTTSRARATASQSVNNAAASGRRKRSPRSTAASAAGRPALRRRRRRLQRHPGLGAHAAAPRGRHRPARHLRAPEVRLRRPARHLRQRRQEHKIDYILLSPALFDKVTAGGVFRKGVWGGRNGTLLPHYDTMTKPVHPASDHAAVFADIAI